MKTYLCRFYKSTHNKKKQTKSLKVNFKKKKLIVISKNKLVFERRVIISKVYDTLYTNIIAKNKNKSLNLLKENALNADLKVPILVDQKFIKKKEVMPIISHPKKRETKFPEDTKKTMLTINIFKKTKSLSTKGSYLKYENV